MSVGGGLASVGTLDVTAVVLGLETRAVDGGSGLHVETTLDVVEFWQFRARGKYVSLVTSVT